MPTVTSLKLKVSRDAARAARLAASAASRCAAMVRRQGSDGAAAPDPLLRRSFNQPLLRISRSAAASRPRFANISIPDPPPGNPSFETAAAIILSWITVSSPILHQLNLR